MLGVAYRSSLKIAVDAETLHCRRRSHAHSCRAATATNGGREVGVGETKYELPSKVPTMDILDGILVLIVVVCLVVPLIYRWWYGVDLFGK